MPEQTCASPPICGGSGSSDSVYTAPGAMAARKAVESILTGNNDCSAWLNKAAGWFNDLSGGDDAAVTANDYFETDSIRNIKGLGGGDLGGRVEQGTGFGAGILLNPIGFFYYSVSTTMGVMKPGGYTGGQIGAQILVLLHEFAHTINAIPPDATKYAKVSSGDNTDTVLKNCRKAIDAAIKGDEVTIACLENEGGAQAHEGHGYILIYHCAQYQYSFPQWKRFTETDGVNRGYR